MGWIVAERSGAGSKILWLHFLRGNSQDGPMKIISSLKVVARAGLMTAFVLVCGGCKENAKSEDAKTVEKAGSQSTAKMEAIRQAGYPVTLAELHAWYAEPPAGENGAAAYQQAFAALTKGCQAR